MTKKPTKPSVPSKKAAAKKTRAPAPRQLEPGEATENQRGDDNEALQAKPAAAPKPARKPRAPRVAEDDIPEQSAIVDRSVRQSHMALRLKVKMFYDLQSMRITAAGRTDPKSKDAEVQLHQVDKFILTLRAQELEKAEKNALRDVEKHLQSIGVYNDVFNDKTRYRGIGPTLWGVILSEFDVERDTVSKWWSFAGLVPVPCRRCKGCNRIVERGEGDAYVHKTAQKRFVKKGPDGEPEKEPPVVKCQWKVVFPVNTYESGHTVRPVRGEKNKFNAWLRTKLCGVLAPCLIKLNSPWREHYDNYKNRLQHREGGAWGTSDIHRHAASMRYMVKMLLIDIHRSWRKHEGLPVRPSYAEEYLGRAPHEGGVSQTRRPDDDGLESDDPMLAAQVEAELALHREERPQA